jgi:ketosteroid isomerase-like protein
MTAPHFDVAVTALTAALGDRLAPGITDFVDLFREDAIIDVPFDGSGTERPMQGRAALQQMTTSLRGILRFDEVTILELHDTHQRGTIICEYEALLHRSDLRGSFRRRYISVITIHGGRITHLREYGGPFIPAASTVP